jgi:hypothetical protein
MYGRTAQLLDEVQRRPDLYPQLRPQFVEMAGALDPRLAQEVPESYDPQRVRGMLQFVTGGAEQVDLRSRGLAALEAAHAETENALKRDALYRESLSNWLATADDAEEWRSTQAYARRFGIPAETIAQFGDWSPEAPVRAARLGMTPAQQRAGAGESDYARHLQRWAGDQGTTVDALSAGDELKAREAFFARSRADGPGTSAAETARARRDAIEDVRAALRFKLENPDDVSVSLHDLKATMRRLGMRPCAVERHAAATAIRRDALAQARTADLAGTEVDGVSSIEAIIERAEAAAHRQRGRSAGAGVGSTPPAPMPAPHTPRVRTASRADVQAVATRLQISYDDARRQLEARGARITGD